jgi:hypothetical protein
VLERYVTIRDIQFKIERDDNYRSGTSDYTVKYKRDESQKSEDILITVGVRSYGFDLYAFYNFLKTPESRGLGLEILCFVLKTIFDDAPWEKLQFRRPNTIDLLALGGGPQSKEKNPLTVENMQQLIQYYQHLGFERSDKSFQDEHQLRRDKRDGVFMTQDVRKFLTRTCAKYATTLAKKAEILGVGGSQTIYVERKPECYSVGGCGL